MRLHRSFEVHLPAGHNRPFIADPESTNIPVQIRGQFRQLLARRCRLPRRLLPMVGDRRNVRHAGIDLPHCRRLLRRRRGDLRNHVAHMLRRRNDLLESRPGFRRLRHAQLHQPCSRLHLLHRRRVSCCTVRSSPQFPASPASSAPPDCAPRPPPRQILVRVRRPAPPQSPHSAPANSSDRDLLDHPHDCRSASTASQL